MRFFIVLSLFCSRLFSWELSCPNGCGGLKDPDRIWMLQIVDLCMFRLGFKSGPSFEIYEAVRTQQECNPLGKDPFSEQLKAELFWHCSGDWWGLWSYEFRNSLPYGIPEEEDYVVVRSLERHVFDPREGKSIYASPREETRYRIGNLSETLAIFDALRSDVDFAYNTKVEGCNRRIEYGQEEIEYLSRKNPLFCESGCEFWDSRCYIGKAIRDHEFRIRMRRYEIKEAEAARDKGYKAIDSALERIHVRYNSIYDYCAKNHGWRGAYYERGLLSFYKGLVFNAIQDISQFIDACRKAESEEFLPAEAFLKKGSLELEIGKYTDAIESLSAALKKDPKNRKIYLERAAAYFETGAFDLALQDYLAQKIPSGNPAISSWDFTAGLTIGAATGIQHALKEFLPSMVAFAKGMGNMVWTKLFSREFQQAFVEHIGMFSQGCEEYFSHPVEETVEAYDLLSAAFGPKLKQVGKGCSDAFAHPIQASRESCALLKNASDEFFNIMKTCSKEDLARYLPSEFYVLVNQWENLSEFERGQLMGYACGKYSTDVLLPIAVVKGVKAVQALRELQTANKICTLETLAATAGKEESLAKVVTDLSEEQKKILNLLKKEKKAALKPYQGQFLDEITARKLCSEVEINLPGRPQDIPTDYKVKLSKKPGGIVYVDPKNPDHTIRIMEGNPNSPNPAQQKPYVVHTYNNSVLDVHGNPVAYDSVESHISIENFKFFEAKNK